LPELRKIHNLVSIQVYLCDDVFPDAVIDVVPLGSHRLLQLIKVDASIGIFVEEFKGQLKSVVVQ
jgi:hypothetical protein